MTFSQLLHQITNNDLLACDGGEGGTGDEGGAGEQARLARLDQDCLGAWCPVRRIPGLILIHAWNPNDMNTLTSDHVK